VGNGLALIASQHQSAPDRLPGATLLLRAEEKAAAHSAVYPQMPPPA
jgi:hypothetical protein